MTIDKIFDKKEINAQYITYGFIALVAFVLIIIFNILNINGWYAALLIPPAVIVVLFVGVKCSRLRAILNKINNDLDFLRYKVTKIGYYIEKETLVKDSGIIYTIIQFKKGHHFYNKKQLYFGPCLLKENNSLFQEKCQIELKKLEQFYPMIPKSHCHHRYKTLWKIKYLKKIYTETLKNIPKHDILLR